MGPPTPPSSFPFSSTFSHPQHHTTPAGTSKINYMDPRITAAWCKKVELPIERVFQKSLLDKFPWAMDVKSTWKF